jgi:4-hydroxy-2-oxoheptanedioate aldolase
VVKEAAASGKRVRGLHLTFPSPTIIELLGPRHIDFVYLDGEHGNFDGRDIEVACVAAERHGLTAIARVPDGQVPTITRFLDRGVTGIIVPHVESIAAAQAAIHATYFAPLGARSFGAGRPLYGAIADRPAHLLACNAHVSLCLMIESRAGLELAGELAAQEGVDYLSYGMMDLAQDLGHPGEPGHAVVKQAVAKSSERIHATGKRVREDFMTYAWINDLIVAGADKLLGKPE